MKEYECIKPFSVPYFDIETDSYDEDKYFDVEVGSFWEREDEDLSVSYTGADIHLDGDKCGKPVDYEQNGININFEHYGVVKFMPNSRDEHFQVCDECARYVVDFIKGEIRVESEGK